MVIGIITSGFSQTSYPKRIIWESDTVLIITRPQLIKINRSINEGRHLRSINKNLQSTLRAADSLSFYWQKVAIANDSLYHLEAQKFNNLAEVNANLQVELKDEKRKSRNIGIGVGVGSALLGVILGVLLGK